MGFTTRAHSTIGINVFSPNELTSPTTTTGSGGCGNFIFATAKAVLLNASWASSTLPLQSLDGVAVNTINFPIEERHARSASLAGGLWTLSWWALVLSVLFGYPVIGMAVASIVIAAHFIAPSWTQQKKRVAHIFIGVGIGIAGEVIFQRVGLYTYMGDSLLPPPWIWALWVLFYCGLERVILPLLQRPIIAALIMAVTAPFAYAGAAQFELLTIQSPLVYPLLGVHYLGCTLASSFLLRTAQ